MHLLWEEYLGGWRCCSWLERPGSNPTGCSAGLGDPTWLSDSQWHPGGNNNQNCHDQHGVSEAVPITLPKVGHGAAKWQIKKGPFS